jgi:uncharacterized membrane protein YraQ (UPF0718 family)
MHPTSLAVTAAAGAASPLAPAAPPLTLAGDTRFVRWPEQIENGEWGFMQAIYVLTAVLVVLSLLASRTKTTQALRIALRRFMRIAPSFVVMLVLIAVALYFVPEQAMLRVLAPESKWAAVGVALGVGSVSIMPGFIAFPLCGVLLERGALYMVLSAFSTTLMMVGVVTLPVEKSYLGGRLAVVRNATSLFIALAVAVVTGLVFGELL